jgi:O-methyltransferase involved in polyketide biosynthesis
MVTQKESARLTRTQRAAVASLHRFALDARSRKPVLGDQHAGGVLAGLQRSGWRLALNRAGAPLVAARAREVDELAAAFLVEHPGGLVLNLGAGLDSRVHRVDPPAGAEWVDLDLPEVVGLRRQHCAPHEAARAVGAAALDESWWDEIPRARPTLVLAEGLLPRLTGEQVHALLDRITERLPRGRVVVDVVAPWVRSLGSAAGLRWSAAHPDEIGGRHRQLCLLESAVLSDLVGQQNRPLGRAVAAVPELATAVRLLHYGFGPGEDPSA